MKRSKLAVFTATLMLAFNGACIMNSVSAEETENVFDVKALGVRGDVNDDGNLSVFDLLKYSMYFLGSADNFDVSYKSDINGDGKINVADYTILKSVLLGDYKIWSGYNMPVMDGSTSAIPLEAGFKSKMLGINYSDAKTLVNHHKTHESFQMLLSGENDMIFTVPISDSQKSDAEKAGVKLNLEPVAKEGFVFVVNKNNPVDTLTQEQIRDIYSGRITNWKEVGGNDEKILPYQRNTDSGSQNYMIDFMKNDTLEEPLKEYKIGSMGSLMDAIAVYDNAEGAIGYSVYSYAAQMYENSADVKFIAVDGVKPSRETMSDSTYPLLSSTYIMYTDKASKNTLDFVKWATSEEGQNCVLENGYVPVKDIEYPDRLKLYRAVGTGREKSPDYKPYRLESTFADVHHSSFVSSYDASEYSVNFLADKEFQKTVNSDIAAAVETAGRKAEIDVTGINGYMSVMIYTNSDKYYGEGEYRNQCYDKIITLNYDLINSRKIENFSDLFYKDSDFVQMVNDAVSHDIASCDSRLLKTDFLGLTGSVKNFTVNRVFFEDDNPYFTEKISAMINSSWTPYTYWMPDIMVTGEYFDMNRVLDTDVKSAGDKESRDEWLYENTVDENGELYSTPTGSAFHTDEEVDAYRKVRDKVFAQAVEIRKTLDWGRDSRILITDPYKAVYAKTLNVIHINFGKNDGGYSKYMFDPETGEEIKLSDIFGDFAAYDDKIMISPYVDFEENRMTVTVKSEQDGNVETLELLFDPDKLNSRYINEPYNQSKPVSVPLDTPRKGEYKFEWGGYGYKSSYILENGPMETQWPIEGKWHLTAKNKCIRQGSVWYECWDSDDGDYYGWINEYEIDFY